jgi:hypothetical protein
LADEVIVDITINNPSLQAKKNRGPCTSSDTPAGFTEKRK